MSNKLLVTLNSNDPNIEYRLLCIEMYKTSLFARISVLVFL